MMKHIFNEKHAENMCYNIYLCSVKLKQIVMTKLFQSGISYLN